MIPRFPMPHGRREVLVRGTVVEIIPAKSPTGLFKRFKAGTPAVVRVMIDDEPYRKLQNILTSATEGRGIAQNFGIGWNMPDPMPSKGSRVRVTFAYAGPTETFFEGAPMYSYKGLEVIENEWEVREGELVADEPSLPLKAA